MLWQLQMSVIVYESYYPDACAVIIWGVCQFLCNSSISFPNNTVTVFVIVVNEPAQ